MTRGKSIVEPLKLFKNAGTNAAIATIFFGIGIFFLIRCAAIDIAEAHTLWKVTDICGLWPIFLVVSAINVWLAFVKFGKACTSLISENYDKA